MDAWELREPVATERLRLRAFTPEDFDALYSYQSREDVATYLYWEPRTEAEVRESLALKVAATRIRDEGDVLCLAMARADDGTVVGDIVLHLVNLAYRTAEIGFITHPDHHGRGYATEAGLAVLGLAFDAMAMHRVIGRTEARNTASARVLEKLGMRREAHLVENEFVKGEWQSELVYAILAREWRDGRR